MGGGWVPIAFSFSFFHFLFRAAAAYLVGAARPAQQVLTRNGGWRAGGAERSVGPAGLSDEATRLADN